MNEKTTEERPQALIEMVKKWEAEDLRADFSTEDELMEQLNRNRWLSGNYRMLTPEAQRIADALREPREKIANARPYYERFRAYASLRGPGWGSLHVALADGNLDDYCVAHCREFAREEGDGEGVELAELLLRMSEGQRQRLMEKCHR